jgi:histidyl-tRNA synthetase
MEFADKKHVGYVIFVGESEIANGTVTIKTMSTGEQRTIPAAELVDFCK